jgi:hypothetical protein
MPPLKKDASPKLVTAIFQIESRADECFASIGLLKHHRNVALGGLLVGGKTADRATSRLPSSLHVKGEIFGDEDPVIDGSVEGLIQLDERKLTVGTTATVVADIIADEVVVYGKMKGTCARRAGSR